MNIDYLMAKLFLYLKIESICSNKFENKKLVGIKIDTICPHFN